MLQSSQGFTLFLANRVRTNTAIHSKVNRFKSVFHCWKLPNSSSCLSLSLGQALLRNPGCFPGLLCDPPGQLPRPSEQLSFFLLNLCHIKFISECLTENSSVEQRAHLLIRPRYPGSWPPKSMPPRAAETPGCVYRLHTHAPVF